MTTVNNVKNDPNYISVLDHGFIGIAYEEDHEGKLIPAVMGNDSSITRAARVSYGQGTKQTSNDRGLLRYLLRNKHTTPFEMCEIKFHAKMPIFVARQWVRHRTANINEYSGRYSIMSDEFYVPAIENLKPQSEDNKQGRSGELLEEDALEVQRWMEEIHEETYLSYLGLMMEEEDGGAFSREGYGENEMDPFPGLARESARGILPVSNYTEWYWKCDLHNIFHFMHLRLDPHAQYEIRVYAEAMYELVKRFYPLATEAFDDYIRFAKSFSRMEMKMLSDMVKGELELTKINEDIAAMYGLSKRELKEFLEKL